MIRRGEEEDLLFKEPVDNAMPSNSLLTASAWRLSYQVTDGLFCLAVQTYLPTEGSRRHRLLPLAKSSFACCWP